MTKEERTTILVALVFLILSIASVCLIAIAIADAGGVEGIAVTAGKEIKDIAKQVAEDD